jgi:hypothetical protein
LGAFEAVLAGDARLILFTTAPDAVPLWEARIAPGDTLLFGSESRGAPPEVHSRADLRVRIPQVEGTRSLNLAVAAGIGSPRRCGRRNAPPKADRRPWPPARAGAQLGACKRRRGGATAPAMSELDQEQQAARDWFEALRDRICAEFEAIEAEAGGSAAFEYLPWERTDPDGSPGGGGVRG